MKRIDLAFLCDPETQEELLLEDAVFEGEEVVEGWLRSSRSRYPIINGIPRFVGAHSYSDNFGYQWNRWARIQFEDQNIGSAMAGHTTAMFDTITGFGPSSLAGTTVLDLGCGSGRFADIAFRRGARVIAVDHSTAIDAAKANFRDCEANILFVQADALRLPVRSNSIDRCYSIGVLHHTPSPGTGVREALRILKDGGAFAIRVYPKDGYYTFLSVRIWRRVFMACRPLLQHYPALVYSYLFGTLGFLLGKMWRPLSYPLRFFFPTAWLPDFRWTILDTFDSVATTHQSGHAPAEVRTWLQDAGFGNIEHRQGNDFVGRK